jgi:hypothetical protein
VLLLILLLGLPLLVRPRVATALFPKDLPKYLKRIMKGMCLMKSRPKELSKKRVWNPARLVGSTEGTVRCWAPCRIVPLGGIDRIS